MEDGLVVDEPPVYEHVIALATSQSRIQRGTIKVSSDTTCLATESSAHSITERVVVRCSCAAVQIRKRTVPIYFENSHLEDYWTQLQQMGPFREWWVLVL